MAKTKMLCPFSHELCNECAVYRGRHYYLSLCRQYHGCIDKPEDIETRDFKRSVDLEAFRQWVEPWMQERNLEIEPDIELEVIDMDSGESRTVKLEDIKDWEWDDDKTIRMVDGIQITSWEKLVQLISYKVQKGDRELKLHEAPHFILIAGG